MKTIDEVLEESFNSNMTKTLHHLTRMQSERVKEAMLEYGKVCIEECANRADADYTYLGSKSDLDHELVEVYVLKESVLDVIKDLK